jgi:hypothetical protein
LAKDLGLLTEENTLWKKRVKNSLGVEVRVIIGIVIRLKGKIIKSRASVTDRKSLRRQLLIGRRDLTDFVVDPGLIKIKRKK